eukprot:TRINITY_DN41632_c0_g1_i1.p1 TRINITY_DN41632_c0_g1~~TRINITY_DN41632_c0_g1_i1.p1  ORF type:complete len:153 (-),score=37.93 TRINITY_DN41632_c0_g1_i1:77-535(-)
MGANCGCEQPKENEMKPMATNMNDEVMPSSMQAQVTKKVSSDVREPEPVPGEGEEEPRRFFDISVGKTGPEDRLGMDVKHLPGHLEVVKIFPDGAVERTNKAAALRNEDQLLPGDLIHSINGVEGNDRKMVEQCRSQNALQIKASRALSAGK